MCSLNNIHWLTLKAGGDLIQSDLGAKRGREAHTHQLYRDCELHPPMPDFTIHACLEGGARHAGMKTHPTLSSRVYIIIIRDFSTWRRQGIVMCMLGMVEASVGAHIGDFTSLLGS